MLLANSQEKDTNRVVEEYRHNTNVTHALIMRLQFYVATFALHLALSMGFGPTAWTMPKSLVFSAKCDGIRCGVREKREWESVDYRRLGRFPQGQVYL